jgi:membrane protease YdiL (CAAX protease family)
MQPADAVQPGVVRRIARWVGRRLEVVIPPLGVLMFYGMASSSGVTAQPWHVAVVIGIAAAHLGVVLWHPMRVPDKEPAQFDWISILRAARVVLPTVLVGTVISILVRTPEGRSSGGTALWGLAAILLTFLFGTVGLGAERSLGVDLLPIFRRREWIRIFYVLVAAFSFAMVAQLWGGVAEDIAGSIGARAFGEAPLDVEGTASSFDISHPLRVLISLMVGAGLFEELLFRLGILTVVWSLTRRFWIGLLASALVFGLYHITPLSGMDSYLAMPFTAVMTSATMGVYMGLVYRYRGFAAAVLVHGLGDWIVVMMFSTMGQ